MSFRFPGSVSTADIAFVARACTREGLLRSAVDAAVSAMAGEPAGVLPREHRHEVLHAESVEMLLFDLLQRVIFHKDAAGLVLRLAAARISGGPGAWELDATLAGERLDPARHAPGADLKAVTFQGYSVRRGWRGWEARVVLDV